jgi:hypothetical protein
MANTPEISWYGIRTVYHFGKKRDGTNLFEERICVFSAVSEDEAFEKGQREAQQYSEFNKMAWHPVQEAYLQDGDALIDGYEVWSEVFEFSGDLDSFVASRYQPYAYHPDE